MSDERPDSLKPEHKDRHKILREEIMLNCKANNVPVTGEFYLQLIFLTMSQITELAHKLHIRIPPKAARS